MKKKAVDVDRDLVEDLAADLYDDVVDLVNEQEDIEGIAKPLYGYLVLNAASRLFLDGLMFGEFSGVDAAENNEIRDEVIEFADLLSYEILQRFKAFVEKEHPDKKYLH